MSKTVNDPEQPLSEDWWSSILSGEESQTGKANKQIEEQPISQKKLAKSDTQDWELINELMQGDRKIDCKVSEIKNGGLILSHPDFKGFAPVSHLLDSEIIKQKNVTKKDLQHYLGKTLTVKVIEVVPERNRVILSERAANSSQEQRQELLHSLKPGMVFQGKVSNITDFGVFIEMGGVEGMIHISEISWKKVHDPWKVTNIGETLEVEVLEIDYLRSRVSLSRKRLQANPWVEVAEKYPQEVSFEVTVVGLAPYGAFVQLEEGIDGLIHYSQMHLEPGDKPSDILAVGERVLVNLVSIDVENQKMSLRLID